VDGSFAAMECRPAADVAALAVAEGLAGPPGGGHYSLVLHPGVTQALGFPFHPTVWAMAPMAWLLAALVFEML